LDGLVPFFAALDVVVIEHGELVAARDGPEMDHESVHPTLSFVGFLGVVVARVTDEDISHAATCWGTGWPERGGPVDVAGRAMIPASVAFRFAVPAEVRQVLRSDEMARPALPSLSS
jgi:hypothetical protein